MPKRINAANAVVSAAEEVCALYRVPVYRTNSRVVNVVASNRKGSRPMFFGAWTDSLGVKHTGGMADLLATPKLSLVGVAVPLWIECKSGCGRLSEEQVQFSKHVASSGAYWLELRDCAAELLAWFEMMGVKR